MGFEFLGLLLKVDVDVMGMVRLCYSKGKDKLISKVRYAIDCL